MRSKQTGRRFGESESGVTAVIGLIVGISLFSVTFYYITQAAMEKEADTVIADQSVLEAEAAALGDTLLGSGKGWYAASFACRTVGGSKELDEDIFDPDGVSASDAVDGVTGRFGLGEEICLRSTTDVRAINNLSYDKVLNLFNAGYDADPENGHVDYEEARESLRLNERGLDFHIRTQPLLASIRDLLQNGQQDPNLRPLYIGDYYEVNHLVREIEHSISCVDSSDRVTVKLTITNNGTTATVFASLFEIPLDKSIDFSLHTPLLAPDESYTIEFTLRKSSDWVWDDNAAKEIYYEISDDDGDLGNGECDFSGFTMTALTPVVNVFAEADQPYWIKDATESSETIKLNYMAFEGDGDKKKFSDWTLWTTDPLGAPLVAVILPTLSEGGTASQAALLEGAYKGQIKNDLLTVTWNIDVMNVVGEQIESFTELSSSEFGPNKAVLPEIGYLDRISELFSPSVFGAEWDHADLPYQDGGDVFPDLKDVMNQDLVDALTDDDGDVSYEDYTLLIVGSDVDHQSMTASAAKNTIRDWVLGGGTLIVYGSDDQSIQWLQPLFHSDLETANGGLTTPDEDHPILNTPNNLDYAAFQTSTQWGYSSAADESFTHVISTTDGGDIMAVSDPGAFGDGRVLLTSWRPYILTGNQAIDCPAPLTTEDECQALMLMHNMLMLSYRYLYIDYGPEIPDDEPAGSYLRVYNVWHPELHELIALQIQIYVFEG